jgi:CheY-like chemotaxis protein
MPMTDPGQLENALLNLALNARDAMPEGGALIFEAGNVAIGGHGRPGGPELEPGEYVLISVTDTGTGMLPEVLDRAFEPFFTTKEVGKGSGLGLSMVYGFASQSGGRLEIESEPGKGTTAKLYLPQASDNPAAQQRPAEPGLEVIGHGESILVVEDDPSVRELVVGMLASLGYKTLEAAQGNEALEIIDSDQGIDLLFTDVVLPGGMSGLDIAREAVRRRPGLKVVYTTGYARCRAADFSADGEAVEILLKPFRKHDLAIRLAANLRP